MPFSGRDPIFWQKGHHFFKKLHTRVVEINTQRLRRILVRQFLFKIRQGAPKAGQKTSPPWRIDLFVSESLTWIIREKSSRKHKMTETQKRRTGD